MSSSTPSICHKYCEDTHLHGFREAAEARHWIGRVFWTLMILGCFAFACWEIYQTFLAFLTSPTAIEIKDGEVLRIPPILYCPNEYINDTARLSIGLTDEGLDFLESMIPGVACKLYTELAVDLAPGERADLSSVLAGSSNVQDVMTQNGLTTPRDLLYLITNDLTYSCPFDTCFDRKRLTSQGMCYHIHVNITDGVFNPISATVDIFFGMSPATGGGGSGSGGSSSSNSSNSLSGTGVTTAVDGNGLTTVNRENATTPRFDGRRRRRRSIGEATTATAETSSGGTTIVEVEEPDELLVLIGDDAKEYFVTDKMYDVTSTYSQFRVYPIHRTRLPPCYTEDPSASLEKASEAILCTEKCYKRTLEHCKDCEMMFNEDIVPSTTDLSKFCNISAFAETCAPALQTCTRAEGNGAKELLENCIRKCSKSCNQWIYVVTAEREDVTTEKYSAFVKNKENILEFHEYPSYSWDMLISNVGGQLGLWMGASIMTFVHGIYFFCTTRKNNVKTDPSQGSTVDAGSNASDGETKSWYMSGE